jgi:hypothetical protein
MRIYQRHLVAVFCVSLLAMICAEAAMAQNPLQLYGYFSSRYEKTLATQGPGGVIAEASPAEWSYPYFNLMMQYSPAEKFKAFFNLNGSSAGTIDVRNFWGEYSAANYFNVRVGKTYRKFGLYNEILDAVPTYYGIEPPELFDADHLIISRTTTFMIYGGVTAGSGTINYSASTDNGEGYPENGPGKGTFPLGYDLNYKFGGGDYTIGISGYTSGGEAMPNVPLGGGSPKSGVLPWMASDKFSVFGGYAEAIIGHLTLQAEYWGSPHNAQRDPASVITVINNAGLNQRQLNQFLIDPNGSITDPANVRVDSKFTIKTWYIRTGYSFETSIGEVGPYAQWDYYSNPETISKKKYGGDAEAGEADDGVFNKSTVGILYRPIPDVAVKFDQSFHFYKSNGENVRYPEIRLDFSFTFGI